ncbi:MAG TPA: sugar transferase, partial [Clostridia bacterium]
MFYRQFFKRFFDIVLSFLALVILSPLILLVALLVRIKLGKPVLFNQIRPGKNGKLFVLHKFRTMTNAKDAQGNLLPDDQRLTSFGKFLRSTSLDELPQIWDIFRGKMSIIGPRPQLVKDLVFMNEEQNKRHLVRGGLTGLAQVMGRNNLTWEERFKYDIEYVKKYSLFLDIKIFFLTIIKVL